MIGRLLGLHTQRISRLSRPLGEIARRAQRKSVERDFAGLLKPLCSRVNPTPRSFRQGN
jgi:hypothetical protein